MSEDLSQVRHDLKNLVGQVLGYSEMLLEDLEGTPSAADAGKIHAAGKRLLTTIDERLTDTLNPTKYVEPPRREFQVSQAMDEGCILVVDDNADNRDVLARRLAKRGYRVSSVEDGESALAALRCDPFDVVLLDVMMPGIDGVEVLRRVKADDHLRAIPVIMISALDELDAVVRCIEIGAADYLSKPFDSTLLYARVGACLREKRAHDREVALREELEQNYGRLQELEKMRDDLTAMIVHDLRTPLTSILSGLQTAQMAGEMDELQEEMIGIAIDGSETLLGMINDLLDVSKLEDGSMKLEVGDVASDALAVKSISQVANLAKVRGVAFIDGVARPGTTFRGDEDKLRRTLINLLGNALKFTPSGGTVELIGHVREDEIEFAVKDTGEGIPEESFNRIFEKFGQVESRKAGRKMSTGLGLTFCKMVVEAHGGRIWVESQVGVGSTFRFTLPLTQ
ncbi:hybrid sensor histidine kinase/response regulator [bacterium]|nr:MAG: hybrid sensor histidine kinase/response regulator [bacterium]